MNPLRGITRINNTRTHVNSPLSVDVHACSSDDMVAESARSGTFGFLQPLMQHSEDRPDGLVFVYSFNSRASQEAIGSWSRGIAGVFTKDVNSRATGPRYMFIGDLTGAREDAESQLYHVHQLQRKAFTGACCIDALYAQRGIFPNERRYSTRGCAGQVLPHRRGKGVRARGCLLVFPQAASPAKAGRKQNGSRENGTIACRRDKELGGGNGPPSHPPEQVWFRNHV